MLKGSKQGSKAKVAGRQGNLYKTPPRIVVLCHIKFIYSFHVFLLIYQYIYSFNRDYVKYKLKKKVTTKLVSLISW